MSYFLRPYLLTLACLFAACAESPENADPEARNEQSSKDGGGAPRRDASSSDGEEDGDDDPPAQTKDAGIKRDASTPSTPTTPKDGGNSSNTSKDAGGSASNPLDDLLGGFIDILAPKDAGTKRDGG